MWPGSNPGVDAICGLSLLLVREVFLRVLRFSPLLKNQHFQILIRPGNQIDEEPLCGCATLLSNIHLFIYIYLLYLSNQNTAQFIIWQRLGAK